MGNEGGGETVLELPFWLLTAAVALALAATVAEAAARGAWSYVVRGVSAIVCVAGIANI